MPLTASQIDIVQNTLHAASSLSFSGSLLTIIAFLILRRTHMRYPQNLVFLLAFNSIGFDIAWMLMPTPDKLADPAHANGPLCQSQGFLLTYFTLSTVLICLLMSTNTYLAVVHRIPMYKYPTTATIVSLIFSNGIALSCALAGSLYEGGIYGPSGAWCWIRAEYSIPKATLAYGWIWAAMAVILFMSFAVRWSIYKLIQTDKERQAGGAAGAGTPPPLAAGATAPATPTRTASPGGAEPAGSARGDRVGKARGATGGLAGTSTTAMGGAVSSGNSAVNARLMEQANRMQLYPIIMLACWLFPTINRVYSAVTNTVNYELTLLHVLSTGLQGLVNSIVYGWTIRFALYEHLAGIAASDDGAFGRCLRKMRCCRAGKGQRAGVTDAHAPVVVLSPVSGKLSKARSGLPSLRMLELAVGPSSSPQAARSTVLSSSAADVDDEDDVIVPQGASTALQASIYGASVGAGSAGRALSHGSSASFSETQDGITRSSSGGIRHPTGAAAPLSLPFQSPAEVIQREASISRIDLAQAHAGGTLPRAY